MKAAKINTFNVSDFAAKVTDYDKMKRIIAKTAEWGHFGRNNTWDK